MTGPAYERRAVDVAVVSGGCSGGHLSVEVAQHADLGAVMGDFVE